MKIVLFDPYLHKFTQGMVDWWRLHGHEVKVDRYYDPKLIAWGDVIWFYTCDNSVKMAMYPDKSDPTMEGWDMHDMDLVGKKIVVNPIDIEVWYGHQNNVDWSLVTDVVFIARHIQDLANRFEGLKSSGARQHVIQHGVDPARWTYRPHTPGFNIAVVSELWESKGTDLVPQVALKLKAIDPRYNIEWVGRWSEYEWDKAYFLDFIERNRLPITLTEWVENLDGLLDDKDYLLHASKKEAWSSVTTEAAVKGIKPVLHAFYGYEPIWGDSGWVWQSVDEAVDMITSQDYDSKSYLDYIHQKGYVLDTQMDRIEREVFNG